MMNKVNYQLNIRKGARIFGGSEDMESDRVKIIKLSGGKTRTELFIDVAICLDRNLLVKEDLLISESGFTEFEISKGKHVLHVRSEKGASALTKELDISKDLWIDINYDYYFSDHHPEAHKQGFHFIVRDYPTYFK